MFSRRRPSLGPVVEAHEAGGDIGQADREAKFARARAHA